MNWWHRISHKPFFIRLMHWEFWSFHSVYLPIYPVWLYYCARAKSFFFFSASNPTFDNGGFLMESKMKIYDLLPKEFYPKTILIKPEETEEIILEKFQKAAFVFPVIAKPDIGGKGRGVKKIDSANELVSYLKMFPFDMLIQEMIDLEQEVGIFYYRLPGSLKGQISGIVGKLFLTVKGDGTSTMEQLLMKDKRHILQLPSLKRSLKEGINEVLPEGEERLLVPYGNHARGAMFVDYSEWIDEDLERVVDDICQRIPGFYYGRLDIRFHSLDELKKASKFSIIEVNGAGSEPTHMYDPKHSLFYAWKEIIRHWKLLYQISAANKAAGNKYLPFKEGVKMFRDARAYDRLLEKI